jgi:hypothetical protein
MPQRKTQSSRKMWPFSGVPLEAASFLGDIANLILLVSLVAGVVSTFVIVRTTNVKEHHWDEARKRSDERIIELVAESDKAHAAIAGANERAAIAAQKAAEADERARKSELELVKIQTPRTLTAEQQAAMVKILAPASKGPVAVFSPFLESTDAKAFAKSIEETLKKAGFEISDVPTPLKNTLSFDQPGARMFVHDESNTPPHAFPVQLAFAAIGMYLAGDIKPDDAPPGMVVIAVSSHPLKSEPIPEVLLRQIPKAP